MASVTINPERAYELIEKGICSRRDFQNLESPYFKRLSRNQYKCLRCNHPVTSFMGIMQHIKKHKNQDSRLKNNKRLT